MADRWEVILLRPARHYLRKLSKYEQKRIMKALETLERDPAQVSIKPLVGRPERSLRVGTRRILLHIIREQRQVFVTCIVPGVMFINGETLLEEVWMLLRPFYDKGLLLQLSITSLLLSKYM